MNVSESSMKLCDSVTFCQKLIFRRMSDNYSGNLHTGYRANAVEKAWLLFRLLYGTQEVLVGWRWSGTSGQSPQGLQYRSQQGRRMVL